MPDIGNISQIENGTVHDLHPCHQMFPEYEQWINLQKIAHIWVSLPLAILVIAITIIFIFIVIRAMQNRTVSRKCYLLILSRSMADLFQSIAILSIDVYMTNSASVLLKDANCIYEEFQKYVGIVRYIRIACLLKFSLITTITYIILSMMKMFAVIRPFHYKSLVTLSKIVTVVIISPILQGKIFSWAINVVIAVVNVIMAVFSNRECFMWYARVFGIIVVLLFLATVISFFITVVTIKRVQHRRSFTSPTTTDGCVSEEGSVKNQSPQSLPTTKPLRHFPRLRFSLWKLSLNVGTFTVANIMFMIAIFVLLYSHTCSQMSFQIVVFEAVVTNIQSLRIILDPVFSLASDTAIRQSTLALFRVHKLTSFLQR